MRNISATLFTCCVVLLIADTISAQRPIRPDPNAERALSQYQKGWQHMRAEQYEDALQAFARALELNPRLNLAHYGKGRAYMGLRRYTEAVQSYSVCRENYIAEAGKKYASQVEATRAQQDRLLELRFLQQQSTSGPQNARSHDQQRQIQDAVRIAENAIQRGINISIAGSGKRVLPVGAYGRCREGVQGGAGSRLEGRRSAQQPGSDLSAERSPVGG
jgi:tetratricopeptide (TPR) repeat protein